MLILNHVVEDRILNGYNNVKGANQRRLTN